MKCKKSRNNDYPKYKVCCVFNIAHPRVLIQVAFVACFELFVLIWRNTQLIEFSLLAAIYMVGLWYYLKKQRWVTLKEHTISYRENVFFHSPHTHYHLGGGLRVLGGRRAGVDFIISDITSLELKQTRFERFFNVGHIQIEGRTDFITKEKLMEQVPDRDRHVIHGIRNFSKFCQECKERFPNVIRYQ